MFCFKCNFLLCCAPYNKFFFIYRISTNQSPRCLFNFGNLRCGAYFSAALNEEKRLFQRKSNYSQEISALCDNE